ncbi:VOC family protein [Henriciella sp.]|uniref:VOC family protein n=1 Tax=Henriciella sp. TaxID=1968823 RepID=UPI00260CADAA|nr:VOC family protein [Henriciella sp.]
MPRPDRFSHAVLFTPNLAKTLEWYRAAFDLDVIAENMRAAIATYDEEHHRFAFVERPLPAGKAAPSPLKHLAYAYDSLEKLVAQYRHMKDLGNTPVECVNHGPTLSFYYEDPDGNGIEFFVDRFATSRETQDFIQSDAFQKNLFGYFVDPDEIGRQLDAGVPESEILRYDQKRADQWLAEFMTSQQS